MCLLIAFKIDFDDLGDVAMRSDEKGIQQIWHHTRMDPRTHAPQ